MRLSDRILFEKHFDHGNTLTLRINLVTIIGIWIYLKVDELFGG